MKGIVYQIYIESNPDIHYVGSTIRTLETRWQQHKTDFNNKTKRRPIICQYFDEFGVDNFQIRVIKEYEVIDSKHLLAYEQLWINKLKPINLVKNLFKSKQIHMIQRKLHRENNRESIRDQKKIYNEKNRESIQEKLRTYYDINRKKICEKSKIYYQKNREHITQKIRDRQPKKYVCQCSPDNEMRLDSKARHEKTLKHQKYLQTLEETKE